MEVPDGVFICVCKRRVGFWEGGSVSGVTVQTSGDLPTIRPLVEGQPSTEFPLQTVSVPSNVNSYYPEGQFAILSAVSLFRVVRKLRN